MFTIIATAASDPLMKGIPYTHKNFARTLYKRKPKHDPTIDPQKIDNQHLEYIEFVNIQKKLYFRQHNN